MIMESDATRAMDSENRTYWESKLETLSRAELEKLQLRRLNESLHLAARSSHYAKCAQIGRMLREGIKSIEQIRELPFMIKDDLHQDFP